MHQVDLVRAQVGHLAARVVPEPAEIVERAVAVVGALGRGPQPQVVIDVGGRSGIRRVAEPRHDVARRGGADTMDLADVPGGQQFHHFLEVRAAAPLRAHLHHALVAPRGGGHPAALLDEQRHGLFDVDVLARGAGHDGLQGVPVIRRGDDDGVDAHVVQHLPEVGVAFGRGAAIGLRPLDARLVDVADGRQFGVFLLFEIRDMPQADQAAADKSDPHAIVGTGDPAIGGRRRRAQESPARGRHSVDSISIRGSPRRPSAPRAQPVPGRRTRPPASRAASPPGPPPRR